MEYNKVYYAKDAFYIDDFISDEEMEVLLEECKKEDGWNFGDQDWENNLKNAEGLALEVLRVINSRIESILDTEKYYLNASTILSRLKKIDNGRDASLGFHADFSDKIERSNGVVYGCILYFNDDFEGGELAYRYLDADGNCKKVDEEIQPVPKDRMLKIKPKAGRLVIHSGYEEYTHGVLPVTDGIRYFVASFIHLIGSPSWAIVAK